MLRRLDGAGRRRLPTSDVYILQLSADGRRLLTMGFRGPPACGTCPPAARGGSSSAAGSGILEPVAVGDDGSRALLSTSRGRARIVELQDGDDDVPLPSPKKAGSPWVGDFDGSGHRLVTSWGRDAVVWDARTGARLAMLSGHVGEVLSASFSASGRRIVTGGSDRTIRLWDAFNGRQLAVIARFKPPARRSSSSTRAEDAVLSTSDEGTLRSTPCEPCRPIEELRALARRRVTRPLTAAEAKDIDQRTASG